MTANCRLGLAAARFRADLDAVRTIFQSALVSPCVICTDAHSARVAATAAFSASIALENEAHSLLS